MHDLTGYKITCNSGRDREQGGRMTGDYLMEMFRNINQIQLPHQPLWFALESFLSTLKKPHITRGESNEEKFD